MMVYGAVEILNAIKVYQLQRFFERNTPKTPVTTTEEAEQDTDNN